MVRNRRAVDAVDRVAVGAREAPSVVICTVRTRDSSLVGGGQPGACRKREVGGVCAGHAVVNIGGSVVGIGVGKLLVVVRNAV